MQPVLAEYFPILVFGVIAAVIGLALVVGSIFAAHQKPYAAKLSAYECGFEAFDNARRKFDVRFYLVAILFIIFDVEVAFFVPLGGQPVPDWAAGFFFHDRLSCGSDRWLYLRVEQGCFGLGVAA